MKTNDKQKELKIGKMLRNLLIQQEQTAMLSRTKASYFGETYTFDAVTREEWDEMVFRALRFLDTKRWYQAVIDRLFK